MKKKHNAKFKKKNSVDLWNKKKTKKQMLIPANFSNPIINQKNKDHIEIYIYKINWDWMMKLKTNNFFIKWPIIKIRNKKYKDWSWKSKKKKD